MSSNETAVEEAKEIQQNERFRKAASVCRELLQSDPFDVMRTIRDLPAGHNKKPAAVAIELGKTDRVQYVISYEDGWNIKVDTKPSERPAGSSATGYLELMDDYDGKSVDVILFGKEQLRVISSDKSTINMCEEQGSFTITGSIDPDTLRYLELSATFLRAFTPEAQVPQIA